jgi:hypothetical protein
MRSVQVTERFEGTVAEAERCWYDTTRWSRWVDGLDRVLAVDDGWPQAGATVTWESGPAGRGRVTERVVAYESLRGQTLDVHDGSIRGRQSVVFVPVQAGVEVSLMLEYQLVRRSIVSPLVDALFIRRAMAVSLGVTVTHFGVELEAARGERGA